MLSSLVGDDPGRHPDGDRGHGALIDVSRRAFADLRQVGKRRQQTNA
jgi:hypothetical protein